MKLFLILIFILSSLVFSQETFLNKNSEKHLCGVVSLDKMLEDTTYTSWFNKKYCKSGVSNSYQFWRDNLKDVEVEIYFGTWCSDSKRNVPHFIKMWDCLGLNRNQLKLIAVYDNTEKTKNKTSPTNEQEGKNIFRVPTFIFYQDGKEIGRIVEDPVNSLEIDLSQIALGVPSIPNYKAANYMMNVIKENDLENLEEIKDSIKIKIKQIAKRDSDLNGLGYFYIEHNKLDEALYIFELNIALFEKVPNVYDSYAETLALLGRKEEAITNYEKVLELDPENKNAKERLEKLLE